MQMPQTQQYSAPLSPVALDTAQAAAYLNMCPTNLSKSRVTGELFGTEPPKHVRYGRVVRYTVDSLNEWLATLPREGGGQP
jgi:hypothetical protein